MVGGGSATFRPKSMTATSDDPLPAPLTCRNLRARDRPATASRLARQSASTASSSTAGPSCCVKSGQTALTPPDDMHARDQDKQLGQDSRAAGQTCSTDPHPNARTPDEPSSNALSTFMCPICFTPPVNATLTPCGHVSCGACLFNAVGIALRRTEDRIAR